MNLPDNAAEGGTEVKRDSPAAAHSCLVQLGRYGDIINILPVAQAIAREEGGKVAMLVHRDYLDLFEGISYIQPIQWTGDQMQPHFAAKSLEGRFDRIIISQAADSSVARERITEAWNMEQWRYAGYLNEWGNQAFKTTIDLRSFQRESELIDSLNLRGKPYLLVNTKSISSPFPKAEQLLHELRTKWGASMTVVDMTVVRAKKFFDLLGLMDEAVALVTVDTSTLHLAAASTVPTIALISDQDKNLWHGSKCRFPIMSSMRYREFEDRKSEIHQCIEKAFLKHTAVELGRISIPDVTLVGVDNFTPARTIAALWFSMKAVTFPRVVLVCQPNPRLPGSDMHGVDVLPIIEGTERVDRERFLVMELGKAFETSHCLHVEWDARVANPSAWDPSWLKYDYIGAPWPWPFKQIDMAGNQMPFPDCTEHNCVGNLGFALISKRFCHAVAEIGKPTPAEARLSDVYMCRTLRPQLERMGIRFAPERVALRFSCEDHFYSGQFGWHGRGTAEMNGFRLL